MDKKRLLELAGVPIKENFNEETLYKEVYAVLHPIMVKLVNDLGGEGENEEMAMELLTAVLREYMQSELSY